MILIGAIACPPAAAEDRNYVELPVDETLRRSHSEIGRIRRNGNFDPGDQELFDQFYTEYFLAHWSQVKNIAKLPKYRQQLRNYFRQARSGEVYNHLNTLVLDFMNKLAADNFHPAVQVNAMLTIGELNSVERTSSKPAVPLPEALKTLIAAVENAKLSDAVRAAAMVGVLRQATAGIQDSEARRSLITAMLRLTAADPPTGPAAPGREWILAQALETLGLLGSPGDANAALKAMLKAVSENRLSFSTRSIAAESLGHLNYAGAAGINPIEAAAALGQFTIDACAEELRLARETSRPVSPRRIKQRLDAVLAALSGEGHGSRKGIMSLAQENQQALLGELWKSVKDASDLLDDKQNKGNDMGPSVRELQSKLAAWLQKKPN